MTDLTPVFDSLLEQRGAPPTKKTFSLDELDEFLKEAYRINSHIALLHNQLKDVRQAYLSTAPSRKAQIYSRSSAKPPQKALTDREREEIDANAKKMLRELNASIRTLADAEQLRHETELALIRKKHSSGLGMLGSWAAGGKGGTGILGGKKSKEHEEAESRESQIAGHRDGVLLFLRQRLQQCVETQQSMMEVRLTREVEKSRSVLAKARPVSTQLGARGSAPPNPQLPLSQRGLQDSTVPSTANLPLQDEEKRRAVPLPELTDEELQMFEKGSQDMMKYYESTLEKVMSAEKSLLEISELQTVLVNSLSTQSAGIEQLVADSMNTEENVGGGNKQLKEATQRASTAKYTFFAASGLCAFLVVWDLLF